MGDDFTGEREGSGNVQENVEDQRGTNGHVQDKHEVSCVANGCGVGGTQEVREEETDQCGEVEDWRVRDVSGRSSFEGGLGKWV